MATTFDLPAIDVHGQYGQFVQPETCGSFSRKERGMRIGVSMGPAVLLFAAMLVAPCAANGDSWQAPEKASSDEVRLAGMWREAQAQNADRLAAPPLDKPDFILADLSQKLERRYIDYSGDISGRWIGAAAFLAPLYPRPFAAFPAIITEIPAYQKADGHFGVAQTLPRIEHDRDIAILWGNGRLLLGLVEVYERTGDGKALETAKKLGDYFIATDAVYDKPENMVRKPGGYYQNFETYYLSCIEGLVGLGRVTRDQRYLDQGRRVAELALTVKNFDNLHCHGRLCAECGIADLYAVTGDPRWREAVERDWKVFMEQYRLPTGGVQEVLAPNWDRDEGCAESDWLRLNLSLWRLTGEGRFLDEAERCLKGHFIFNQFPNGGAGHHVLHSIDGQTVTFKALGEEAWWCCSEHWARAAVELARLAVTGSPKGPSINLMIDCDGAVSGPGGKWNFTMREIADGLRITLQSPIATQATVRIHRPAWAREGARIEKPAALSLRELDGAWFVDGNWTGAQEIVVHLPTTPRSEATPGNAGVLLRGYDLLAAHGVPANAWLTSAMPNVRPVVLWNTALRAENGRVVVPASLKADADPDRPEQWRILELAPLRAATGRPHAAAWFSFQLRAATPERIRLLTHHEVKE
jgi:DUF1680 family protein